MDILNFLNPSAFWFLGFIIVPIIIHFLNKFQVKKVNFSTIQFIKELEISSIRRIKLEELFLLLLRILIILFLVLLFASPVTKGSLPTWLAGEQESITIFVIDNSASMNALQNNKPIIDQIKKQAINIIPLFNNQSKILVYQTCPPKQVYSGAFNNPSLISSINNIKKTSSFDNMWENVNNFLKDETMDEAIKECFVFSDFMYLPSSLDNNQNFKYKNWSFYFIYPEPIMDNLSINSVVLLSRIKTINQLIKLDAKIKNTSISKKNNLPLELLFNEQRVGQIITDVEANREKGFLFQAYPNNNGIVHGKFIIPADNYEYDNSWHMAIPIMKQIKCAIIGSNEQDIELLELLLGSIDPENKFLTIESRNQPILNRLFLDQFDVAIIHNSQKITSDGVKDLEKFLNSGGGVIWFQGNRNHKSYNNNLYETLNFPKNLSVKNSGEGFFSVNIPDKNSDLLQDIKLKSLKNQLPKVFNYSKVAINSGHKVHWLLNNEDPFLLEFNKGAGTIFYFSTLLDLNWNDFTMRGLIVPLIYRMLVLTGTDEINTLPITIDESKWISIKEEDLRKQWEVKSMSGSNSLIVPNYDKEGILISNTEELGLYSVFSEGELFTSFPTRLHKLEYIKPLIDPVDLENFIPKENFHWFQMNLDFKKDLSELRNGKSLWRLFLIIVIVLVVFETIIGKPDPKRIKVES